MPHMHSQEFLAFERLHERERQMKLQHQLAHLNEPQMNNYQRMIGSIGEFFIAVGTRMQKVKQQSEHVV